MMNKRKKNSRARGSWTHGYGEKKKHRGAGSRGGRGMAGTGKRGDVKKPSIQADKKYFGKHGFKQGKRDVVHAINVSTLVHKLDAFVAKKIAVKSGDSYKVDLTKSMYGKLLGAGSATVAMEVSVEQASASAVEKIQAAGGKVNLPAVKEETVAEEAPVEKAEE